MKLYLDDIREPTDDWILVKTVEECLMKLKENIVSELSLDHDLGETSKTGYDVLLWVEERIINDIFYIPPKIHIHTSNPSARVKMELAVKKIEELSEER